MTETQERFLRTVLSRVPLDSVVELHLFPPIRRGTLETGVAVIATVLPPAPVALVLGDEAPEADSGDIPGGPGDAADAEDSADNEAGADIAEATERAAIVDHTAGGHPQAMALVDAPAAVEESPYLDEPDAVAHAGVADEPMTVLSVPSPRMRILTAAYRHTIKGVDRGKWAVDVQDEADAPLDAVEAVLRGVRHRSTEPADPEQVGHEALAALVTSSAAAPAAA